ncbi:MAG: MFS transporter [Nitrospinae bacterium]|nr:MFS transporter [Nitrospinota bacterium]
MTLLFNVNYFIYFYTLWLVETFLPIYFKSISISDKWVGFLVGLFAASSSITIIPVGFISDRLSPCLIIRFGIGLFMIYILGLIKFNSLPLISVVTLIGGFGSTLIHIGLSTTFYKGLEERGRGSRIGSFFFSSSAGYSLGPLSAGYLLHSSKMQSVFISGLICIFILFFLSFFIKERFRSRVSTGDKLKLSDYTSLLVQYRTIFLLLSVSVVGIHLGAEQSSLSLFFKMNLHMPDKSIGTIYAFVGLWVGLLIYITGRIFDRTKKIIVFIWSGMIISGIFQIATTLTTGYWDALMIRLLHTVGDSFIVLCNGLLISIIFKERSMGGGVGLVQGFRMGSIFLSATACGFLNGIYGYNINFIMSGVLSILFGLFVLFFMKRLPASIFYPSRP